MQAASEVLLAPWQTTPGLWLLYGSFITHASLGLYALYRRRHLRMPAAEAWQLALGLTIPLLVIPRRRHPHRAIDLRPRPRFCPRGAWRSGIRHCR